MSVVGPNRSWGTRRSGPIIVVAILLAAGVVAAVLYGSNLLTGTITVDTKIGITGTLPTTYILGEQKISTISVSSYTDATLNAYLVVTITGASGSATVTIAGNSIAPTCGASSCVWTGLSFVLSPRATVPVDVGVTFNLDGDFDWQMQAFGQ